MDAGCQSDDACLEMRAPLPGLVMELHVREGEYVEEQSLVAVLESMKMNLELRAPRAGVVRGLSVDSGQQVGQDDVLIVIGVDAAASGDGHR
jgi:3-methylcrotonyl-CoA carboxylase alpha subunit